MAMAVAAGISSVAVPVYAAPAENTVATDNTDKKEAEAVTDATAEVKENTEVKDRFFREKFVFKNIEYDRTKPYYLVITDEETGIEHIKFG